MRTRFFVFCTALALAAIAPASAITIDDNARLEASCSGYTLTFQGRGFAVADPAETVTLDWTITLQQGGTQYFVTDSFTYVYDNDGTADKVITVTRPWNMKLSDSYEILNCDGVGFFTWSASTGGSSASPWQLVDPATGDLLPAPPPLSNCGSAILNCPMQPVVEQCRRARFWGRHAGNAGGGINITQQVIDAVGFLSVCGQTVDQTNLNSSFSAEEALCVRGISDDRTRLARQLTAASLNCVMSNAGPDCAGASIAATFAACNSACAADTDPAQIASCIRDLHCWNRGGTRLSSGMCQIGTCNGDGVTPCSSDASCSGKGSEPDERSDCDKDDDDDDDTSGQCVRTPGNCLEQPLVNSSLGLNFYPVGRAGSARACREARRNSCTIFSCGQP